MHILLHPPTKLFTSTPHLFPGGKPVLTFALFPPATGATATCRKTCQQVFLLFTHTPTHSSKETKTLSFFREKRRKSPKQKRKWHYHREANSFEKDVTSRDGVAMRAPLYWWEGKSLWKYLVRGWKEKQWEINSLRDCSRESKRKHETSGTRERKWVHRCAVSDWWASEEGESARVC